MINDLHIGQIDGNRIYVGGIFGEKIWHGKVRDQVGDRAVGNGKRHFIHIRILSIEDQLGKDSALIVGKLKQNVG